VSRINPSLSPLACRAVCRCLLSCIVLCAALGVVAPSAAGQERMYFSAVDDVRSVLVQRINAEKVRIDMSAWYLTEGEIVNALLRKHAEGVPIRLIGDRGSIFEIDVHTKYAFYRLAAAGVPIRLRYNPTWYPEIAHWKATIFAGQNIVTFGSANYTPFELAPISSTNYKDETVLFTDDPELVNAFKTQFDRMWTDTTREPLSLVSSPPYFLDWNDACARESACSDYKTLYPNPAPMVIDRSRREPDYPLPSDMVWGQGPPFNNRLVEEINKETSFVDFVIYRLTVPGIADALLAKHRDGVPVRLIIEPNEYLNSG
jgi:phosphatidylserine/phosphatidylglycerophosphate/cardiolipin synthase-like enzyme